MGVAAGLRATPEPFVLQKALGDFCVTYEINVYCNQPQGMNRIYTDLYRNTLDVFNEYGVQIMKKRAGTKHKWTVLSNK